MRPPAGSARSLERGPVDRCGCAFWNGYGCGTPDSRTASTEDRSQKGRRTSVSWRFAILSYHRQICEAAPQTQRDGARSIRATRVSPPSSVVVRRRRAPVWLTCGKAEDRKLFSVILRFRVYRCARVKGLKVSVCWNLHFRICSKKCASEDNVYVLDRPQSIPRKPRNFL